MDLNKVTLKEYLESAEIKVRIHSNVTRYLKKWEKLMPNYGDLELSDPKLKKVANSKSWNWAAFVFTFFWGIWRGVIGSWIVFAIVVAFMLAGLIYPDSLMDKLGNKVALVLEIAYGMYGNSWYLYTLIKKRNDADGSLKPSKLRVLIPIFLIIILIGLSAYLSDKSEDSESHKAKNLSQTHSQDLKQVGDLDELYYYKSSLRKNGDIASISFIVNTVHADPNELGTSKKYSYEFDCNKKKSRVMGNIVEYSKQFANGVVIGSEKGNHQWQGWSDDTYDLDLSALVCASSYVVSP